MKDVMMKLKNEAIAYIFSCVLTYWMISINIEYFKLGSIIITIIINFLLFIGFLYCKSFKRYGIFFFSIGSFIYFFITFFIISLSSNYFGTRYLWWLLYGYSVADISIGYWIGSIMLFSYFFGGTVFYFTCIRFRIWVLLLLSMIVLTMHSTVDNVNVSFIFVLFLFSFFMVYLEYLKRSNMIDIYKKKGNYFDSLRSSICFILILFGVVLIIPKPEILPSNDFLDLIIYGTVRTIGGNPANLSLDNNYKINSLNTVSLLERRYINTGAAPIGEEVLFEVQSEEPLYLRTQSFDQYKNNCWYIGDKSLLSKRDINDEYFRRNVTKYNSIIDLLQKEENQKWLKEKYSETYEGLKHISQSQKDSRITICLNDFTMNVFLHPLGAYHIREIGNNSKIFMAESGICTLEDERLIGSDSVYSIDYISSNSSMNKREYKELYLTNKKDFNEKITYIQEHIPSLTTSESNTLSMIIKEMDDAYNYYTKLDESTSEKIYQLAEEITANKETDIEKALEIQNYFHTNDFIYTTNIPRMRRTNDYIEYFLFESKKGLCVQYATAMVLLSRAAGLPARYVEGFVVLEKDANTNKYLVRGEHAHAFPEVYIAGYGWMTFEPTVGMEEEDTSIIMALLNPIIDFFTQLPLYISLLFVAFLTIMIIMICFFDKIKERLWKNKVYKVTQNQAVELIFKRIISILKKIGLNKKGYETVGEYAARVYEISDIHMDEFVDIFNRSKYGIMKISTEEINNAVEICEQLKLFADKYKKNKKGVAKLS